MRKTSSSIASTARAVSNSAGRVASTAGHIARCEDATGGVDAPATPASATITRRDAPPVAATSSTRYAIV